MLILNRFRVPAEAEDDFVVRARATVAHFEGCEGNLSARLVRNLDEPELWAIIADWENVGAYRRSLNGQEARMMLIPLLGEAINEPSAYGDPDELGTNIPRIGCSRV